MADKVLDSWEDMIDENGVLDKKLDDLKVNETIQELRPNVRPIDTNYSNTSIDSTNSWDKDSTEWPSIATNNKVNDNCNSITILKRPMNTQPMSSRINHSLANSANDSNQNQTPGMCPQISLEDNTRTQYVPQVRILKRPNAKSNKDLNDKSVSNDMKSLNANKSQTNNKTYEEREAEYAKARLRILGSATPPEEPSPSGQVSVPTSSTGSPVRSSNTSNTSNSLSPESRSTKLSPNDTNNVPIVRLPLGPDGTKGFNREPSPQQR